MGEIICAILELIAYCTGELILCAVTLGRYKPKMPYQTKESMMTQELLVTGSTWIGIIFWGAVLVLIAWLLSR
jgi:hypothetical protein